MRSCRGSVFVPEATSSLPEIIATLAKPNRRKVKPYDTEIGTGDDTLKAFGCDGSRRPWRSIRDAARLALAPRM
jgi:hypothetical protein